jgi:putative endopeptidase
MRRIFSTICVTLILSGLGVAQSPAPSGSRVQTKVIKSFDLDAMDRTVDACTDFYQFACGNWMKNNPVPSDQARWGRFDELDENNLLILRDILEGVSAPSGGKNANDRKIGDFYASCMDEEAIEKKGMHNSRPRKIFPLTWHICMLTVPMLSSPSAQIRTSKTPAG